MSRSLVAATLVTAAVLSGCQTAPLGGLAWNPFAEKDRTTYRTPQTRIDEALAVGQRATGEDTPEQRELVVDLARRIQSEPDPLVRKAIVMSVAKFNAPLAHQVLEAGLTDDAPVVRRQCCQELGRRGDPAGVAPLARVVRSDGDIDVRIAATQALGRIESPETTAALVPALEHTNPAMQFAGVESMQQVTGKDFGGHVKSYLAYAKGETPPPRPEEETSIAQRVRNLSPF